MRSAAGHEYLTLRDEGATLDVVRFRGAIRPGEETPIVGEMIVARGRIDLYSPRSRYQLVATVVERARGIGLLSQELEALRRTLQAEGLFDEARKRSIPASPQGIGLVTSASGAVLHDVLRVLRREAPLARRRCLSSTPALTIFALSSACGAAQAQDFTVAVDARETARGILHVKQTFPAKPGGTLALSYPQWIPGEHGPTGPNVDVAGLFPRAGERILSWSQIGRAHV